MSKRQDFKSCISYTWSHSSAIQCTFTCSPLPKTTNTNLWNISRYFGIISQTHVSAKKLSSLYNMQLWFTTINSAYFLFTISSSLTFISQSQPGFPSETPPDRHPAFVSFRKSCARENQSTVTRLNEPDLLHVYYNDAAAPSPRSLWGDFSLLISEADWQQTGHFYWLSWGVTSLQDFLATENLQNHPVALWICVL